MTIINKKDKRNLISNFSYLLIVQIFTYILPLITFPYLVRVLGSDRFGLVVFAQSIMVFFNLITDYGFNLSATRSIAVCKGDKNKITEIFSSVLIIKFFLVIFSLLLIFIGTSFIDRFSQDKEVYYFSFLWVIGQCFFPIWYFQGVEQMKYITYINLLSKIVFTLLIFIFVSDGSDYYIVPILNGIGAILGSVASFYILIRCFHQYFVWQSLNTIKSYLLDSTQYFLSRISVSLYTSINTIVLGLYTNNIMVGYYSIAEKLYQAIQAMYSPLVQILYPYISKTKNILVLRNIIIATLPIFLLGIGGLYVFSSEILVFIFDKSIHEDTIVVFHILLISAVVTFVSSLIGYPLLGALGYSSYINRWIIYASIFHCASLCLLILLGHISIYSISFIVCLTELFIFISRVYLLLKNRIMAYKNFMR